jgi:hypothetical protein
MFITVLYNSKLHIECMYNEQTNAHLIDSFYYTVLYLLLLHVSMPTINMSIFITDCIHGHLRKKFLELLRQYNLLYLRQF